jgi:hypothetical protein
MQFQRGLLLKLNVILTVYKILCQFFLIEPTVQQERIPQVLPPKLGTGGDDPVLLFDVVLLKRENFFFTSGELHCGQTVSFSEAPTFWMREKLVLHLLQMYSYIGIENPP